MSKGWRWLAVQPDDSRDVLTTARERTASWALADQGEASVALSGGGEVDDLALIRPLITDLLVQFDGRGLWRGRFGPFVGSITELEHVEVRSAIDYRGVLSRRLVHETLSYPGIDTAEAAWRLANYTQHEAPYPGGPLGIGRGTWEAAHTTDVEIPSDTKIAEAIDNVAKRYPGFDWWVDADRLLNTERQRGTTREFPLSLIRGGGGTCSQVDPTLDTTTFANLIRQTGGAGTSPVVAYAPDLGTDGRPEGRWETLQADPGLIGQAAVDTTAQTGLARAMTLSPSWEFTLKPGEWTPDDLWVGDFTPIEVRSSHFNISTMERVIKVSITDDGNGTVTPKVEVSNRLAQDVRSLVAFQRTTTAAITRLARS